MRGISAVVLVSPAIPAQELNVVASAAAAGVGHVVKITSKASADSPIARRRDQTEIENGLIASGLGYTLLRNNAYMQNFLMLAPAIAKTGSFGSSTGDGRVGMVDTRDVAAVAAQIAATPAAHQADRPSDRRKPRVRRHGNPSVQSAVYRMQHPVVGRLRRMPGRHPLWRQRYIIAPPLMVSSWPLTQLASGRARNATTAATSSGVPRRPAGDALASWSRTPPAASNAPSPERNPEATGPTSSELLVMSPRLK